MAFDPQQYNSQYLTNIQAGRDPLNDAAEKYGVMIEPAQVAAGQTYWKAIGVHHLLPLENFSNHHVYLEVLDRSGRRSQQPPAWVGWTWEDRGPNEPAPPVAIDKPANEAGANIAINKNQIISVWVKGRSATAEEISDRVTKIRSTHPDEPLPDGTLHNTWGHHSFYIVFQETVKSATQVAPEPQASVIDGVVANGQGRVVVLARDGTAFARLTLAANGVFQFNRLGRGVYTVSVEGTSVQTTNIRLDGQNRQQVNLTVPLPVTEPTPTPTQTPSKLIDHYVLFGPAQGSLSRSVYFIALDFLLRFSLSAGFSLGTAKLARQVTIIGDGFTPQQIESLRQSGTQVEQLRSDLTTLEANLRGRVESGRSFGG